MRTKEEVLKDSETVGGATFEMVALLYDIRDQLKRIADHLGNEPCPCGCESPGMGDRPHLEGKPEITHPATIDKDFIREPDHK